MSLTLISCDNEESDFLEIQDFEQADLRGEGPDEGDRLGNHRGKRHHLLRFLKGDCITLTYPVTVDFPDGSSVTANDVDELIAALRTYHASADTTDGHPTFVYPLTITIRDSTFDVNSQEELKRAIKLCKPDRPGHGNRPCFSIVYPLTIEFPNGRTLEVANRKEYREALRRWKSNNPDSTERPVIVFPIEIEYEDGTIEIINSAEDLAMAKEECD